MATILFYENADPSQLVAAAYDEGVCLWQVNFVKKEAAAWVKQEMKAGRLQKTDVWIAVLAEDAIVRRTLRLSAQLHGRERDGMIENALTVAMGEKPATVRKQRIAGQANGQEQWAVSGVRAEIGLQWQQWFGIWAHRLRLMGAAECRLLFTPAPLADGYYAIEAPLWTAVVAVKDGAVIDGRAAQGRDAKTLHYELMEATQEWVLPPLCLAWPSGTGATPLQASVDGLCFEKWRGLKTMSPAWDRKMVALVVGCVVLPGLLWLGLQGRTVNDADAIENAPQTQAVTRSGYSTLIAQAYEAKSARITLLSHEAAEGALAIHGRCSEVLDLADYMRTLDASAQKLHPLLLDLSKKTEKDRYYYEFVVQISLEGREMP